MDIVIKDFDGQTIIPTDDCQKLYFASFLKKISETCLEPNQPSKKELLTNIFKMF